MKKLFTLLIFFSIMTVTNAQIKLQAVPKEQNPFMEEWNTPYQTPPFDKIKPAHYIPAFEFSIQEAKKDIEAIKSNPEKPTFKNTIVALDAAGQMLNRVSGVFFNILECDATDEMQDIAEKVQPLITQYSNDLFLDEALFKRISYVYENERQKLNPVDQRLLEVTYDEFVSNGAKLSPDDKKKFNDLTLQLSRLTLDFSRNVLSATNAYKMHVKNVSELTGLPDNELAIAAQRAKDNNVEGYMFDLSMPSVSAILKYADNRELRHEMYMHSSSKAYQGPFDNTGVIKKMLVCRYEIAQLLGYKNYAEYVLHNRMAENVENVYKLLDQLRDASMPVAQEEMKSLTVYAQEHGLKDDLQRWDFSYYSEKQQKELFDLNTEDLKPYFKLENVIDGIFKLADSLYDLKLVLNEDIETYHPDVKAYEVQQHGKLKAVLYLDFYTRSTKRGGAWMTTFRDEYVDEKGHDVRPLVSLVMNFAPSVGKTPTLLSYSEVNTFLHEFGHALNGMLSEVPYRSISCTNSQEDFVELPSQMNENWGTCPEFLRMFAFHYKTGELIPANMIKQLKQMDKYQAGYKSVRQLSFGYVDMMWHTTDPRHIDDVLRMEREIFDPLEVMPVVPNACMSTSFGHIFAGQYAAGYYGYKWAEMLEADAFSQFRKNGVMDKKTAQRWEKTVLSKGGSQTGMEMFVNFMGRKPSVEALLKKDGLIK